jgi:hypothetical protein
MEVWPSRELLNSTLNNEEVVTKVRKMSNTLLHEALHAAMVREARNRMVSDGANMDNLYVTFHIPTTIMLLLTEATLFFWNIWHHRAATDDVLLGRIQNWAVNVDSHGKRIPALRRKPSTSSKKCMSTATGPPLSDTLLSTDTPASSVDNAIPQATQHSPKDTFVGGFDDEEMEDGTFERAAVDALDEASQLLVSHNIPTENALLTYEISLRTP